MSREKAPGWVERMADLFELPQEVVLDLPQVAIVGNGFLRLENHRGIIEYQPELVRINTSRGEIAIHGKKLEIRSIVPEEVVVAGLISAVEMSDWGEY